MGTDVSAYLLLIFFLPLCIAVQRGFETIKCVY